MRALDLQAVDACRTVVALLTAAAQTDADLTPAERRHLLAIARALSALVEPRPPPEQGSAPAGESAQPDPA